MPKQPPYKKVRLEAIIENLVKIRFKHRLPLKNKREITLDVLKWSEEDKETYYNNLIKKKNKEE